MELALMGKYAFMLAKAFADIMLYMLIVGKNKRYNNLDTAIVLCCVYIIWNESLITEPYMHILFVVLGYFGIVICIKKNIINLITLYFVGRYLCDLMLSISTSVVLVVKMMISGKEVHWVTSGDIGLGTYLLASALVIIFAWVAYRLCRIFRERVLNLGKILKYACFILIPVMSFTKMILLVILDVHYSANPGGFLMIIDVTPAVASALLCIVMLLKVSLQKRRENKLLKERMNTEREKYDEIIELKEGLREMNHDLKNYLSVADSLDEEQKEEYQNRIKEYCEHINKEQ